MRPLSIAAILFALVFAACTGQDPAEISVAKTAIDPGKVRVSSEGKHASEAGVASTSDGRLFVVWSERDENKKHDIFVREYAVSLEPKAPAIRVNPNPGEARTWYGDVPSILVAPEGTIYVGWNRTYADGSPGNDLVVSISRDGGKSFAEPIKINDDTAPASHGMHGMTLDARGRLLISWLDERYLKSRTMHASSKTRSNSGPFLAMFFHNAPAAKHAESEEPDAELYFAVVNDGKVVGPNRKIAKGICPCCRVSAITAPDGTVYVAYRKVYPGQFRHISISTSRDGGESFSDPVQVSDDQWKLFACPVNGAAMRINGDDLEVAWYSGGGRGEKGLYRTISGNKGTTFSPPNLISKTMIKGTPVFAGNDLVFGDPETIHVSSDQGMQTMAGGSTPSAVTVDGRLFVAFAASSDENSSVWLTHSKINGTRTLAR